MKISFTNLGNLYATKGVHEKGTTDKVFHSFLIDCLTRYQKGDWGDLCKEDKQMNDYAVFHEERVLAKYNYDKDTSIYIITEWDRSATTMLFPEEY